MAIANGTRFGPYEIQTPLGAGGMGEVYRARDTRLGREVAIKVLPAAFASDPDRLRRFEQEARAASALNHPNILVLHDVGTHEGAPYLVTELLEGETLRARMGGTALPPRKAIDYALQIARGLAAAHERGLVHRDLKPENIFVLRDGRVKILDFGLAKLTRPEPPAGGGATRAAMPTATIDTDPGLVMGTAGYMAPEQVRGLPADHRADIFALGAILYEMLSGRRAFQGSTSAETMTAILREEPPDLSRDGRLPPALERIVRHCLEKSPHERFQAASDIAFALGELSGISDSGPKTAIASAKAPSWRRLLVPAWVGLGLLAAGALVGREFPRGPAASTAEYRKLTFGRGSVKVARFSGDGHSVFYSAAWEGGRLEVYTCALDTPGSLNMGAPANSYLLGLSRSNEMAILLRYRERPQGTAVGTLARMSTGGAPREILDDVTAADWSPDGSALAVVHVVGNRYRLEYPIGTVLYESPGWITDIRVAPDGRSVAYLDHPVFPDDRGSVMTVSVGGQARVLCGGFASEQGLAWEPTGREILFSAATIGAARSIYAVDLQGRLRCAAALPGDARVHDISARGDVLITNDRISAEIRGRAAGEDKERELGWLGWSVGAAISADGRTLLFSEEGEGGGQHYAVCVRGMEGSPPVQLGEGDADDLSPDGKWALVTRFWTQPPAIMLLPTGPGQPRTLRPTGLENIEDAQFFPSGDRLLLVGNEHGHAARCYVWGLDKGAPRAITPEGIVSRAGCISPDGRLVVGFARGGEALLYPVEAGSPRAVRGKLPDEIPLGWSRDGESIYVSTPGGRPVQVFRLDLATARRTVWVTEEGPGDGTGTSGGFMIVGRDDHTYAYTYGRYLSELFLARGLR